MRRFLEKLAAMGERTAPGLWASLCDLLCLALCLDATWWRSLPVGVAVAVGLGAWSLRAVGFSLGGLMAMARRGSDEETDSPAS